MADGFGFGGGSSGSGFGFGGTGRRRRSKEKDKGSRFGIVGKIVGAPAGLVGNLAGDVKDAVVGIPFGLVALAKDPKGAGTAIAKATWQTYEPLSHGDFKKFGQNLYDHPLAPILDVATVFTMGAGGAARGASALSKAGAGGARIEKIAGLRKAKTVKLEDPTGQGRHAQSYTFSSRPARRLVQEALAGHLPAWFTRARFESRFQADMAHRGAAKNLAVEKALKRHSDLATPEGLEAMNQQLLAITKGGEVLSNPITAPRVRMELATEHYVNLLRHAPMRLGLGETLPAHYGIVKDARHLDPMASRKLRKAQRLEAKWDRQRAANAELAHALPKLRKELESANAELKRMEREGWTVATRAKTNGPKGLRDNEFAPLVEQQNLVKRLEEQVGKAYQAEGLHKKAVGELEAIKRGRMDAEQRSFAEYFRPASESPEAFESFITRLGQRAVIGTKRPRKITEADLARGAVGADGKLRIVPLHDAKNLAKEAVSSHKMMRWLYQKPTRLWKIALLGYTPRIVTNNFVGNWTIYAARQGGHNAITGIYDAIRLTHGDDVAHASLVSALPSPTRHWLDRYFGDELGNVFGSTLAHEAGKAPSRAASGLYPVVHTLADRPVRAASIAAFMRGAPEVRALMKEKGLSFDAAVARAIRHDRGLRDRASEHARTIAGDYFTLRPWERKIRELVPFYLWDRHILKTAGNMVFDTPGRVALAQRVSQLGIGEAEEFLGELPEFLQGAVPLGKDGHRGDVMLTHSLNPFATIGELAGAAAAALTGDVPRPGAALMGQTNPIVTGLIESVTGQKLLTGAPKERIGGIGPDIYSNMALGLPQPTLLSRLGIVPEGVSEALYGTPAKDPLYARDKRSPISSIFGVPLRDVNMELAAQMAAEEEGKTVGRRRKRRKKKPAYI